MNGVKGWLALGSLLGLLVSCQALVLVEVGKGFDSGHEILLPTVDTLAVRGLPGDGAVASLRLASPVRPRIAASPALPTAAPKTLRIARKAPCNSEKAGAGLERQPTEPELPSLVQPDRRPRCASQRPVAGRPC